MLNLQNISAENQLGTPVLHHLNLNIPAGIVYTILGDSSSGKTTIIKILSGLQRATAGEIFLNQKRITPYAPKKALDAGLSFVFQEDPNTFPGTIWDNIFLGNYVFRIFIRKRILVERAKKLLKEVGLDVNPELSVTELNKDDQSLVLLAKALATNPVALVIDEAVTNLSKITVEKFSRTLIDFRSRGGCVLYLTSFPDQVVHISDTVGILEDGVIKHELTREEIQSDPDLLMKLYLQGGRSKSILKGQLSESTDQIINAFFKSSEILASEFELRDILEFLAERACQLTDARACIIKLIDEDSRNIFSAAQFGRSLESFQEISTNFEQDVIENGKTFWTTNPEVLCQFSQSGKQECTGVALVPIKIRGEIAGIISLFFDHESVHLDMEVIKTFANQTAIGIENTRLLGLSALLQEAHHRIKNNLQSIISLLSLQIEKETSPEVLKAITHSINRIKAIATVHDLLSRDQKASSFVNVRLILQKIVDWNTTKASERNIKIQFNGEDIFLPYKKATPLALAISELLSNCYDHAFPGKKSGKIILQMNVTPEKGTFLVEDNGVGLGEIDLRNAHKEGHLGLWLVRTLVTGDLAGQFEIREFRGTRATITVPLGIKGLRRE